MQTQFIDKWNELSKCASEPFMKIMELNINTFNEWSQNTKSFNDINQLKKPEDLLNVQTRLGAEMMKSMSEYMQRFSEICIESTTEFGKVCNDLSRDAINKATEGATVLKQNAEKVTEKVHSNFKKYKDI